MNNKISTKAMFSVLFILLLSLFSSIKVCALSTSSNISNTSPSWHTDYKTINGPNKPLPSIGKSIKIKPAISVASQSIYPPDSKGGNPPNFIQTAYDLPTSGGTGTIAIISAYQNSTIESDLATYDSQYGISSCTVSNGCLEIHNMGTTDTTNSSWNIESDADVELAHAFAPSAKILLIESVSDYLNDIILSISYANSRSDVVAVSMSFAGSEFPQETQYDTDFVPNFNATFIAATGDMSNITNYGSVGSGVTYPAASPNVVAIGG